MESNEEEGVCYAQPKSLAERVEIARRFVADAGYEIPLVVDRMDNAADEIYAGWPERLYIVGADGKIEYKGDTGPFGYEPDEVDAWLDARP